MNARFFALTVASAVGLLAACGGEDAGAAGQGSGGSPGATGGAPNAATGGASTGAGGTDPGAPPTPALLPATPVSCPPIAEGDVRFGSTWARVWVGDDGASLLGPLVIYWHGTCSFPLEALLGIGQPAIDRIKALGGMVAAIQSPYNSPNDFCRAVGIPGTERCPGTTTGNGVWCREDYDVADQIVACAIQQVGIDPRRIHTVGMSAGGVMATAYAYSRSGYVASMATYSGGGVARIVAPTIQDPTNEYAAMIVYGGPTDVVGLANFETITGLYQDELTSLGHFSFVCNHAQGHRIPPGIGDSAVQFFVDHPFGVSPEPYESGLPASFPAYCALP